MSRKANADRSSWKTASCYAIVGDYGPFKFRGSGPLENVLVLLSCSKEERGHHALLHWNLAAPSQHLLLRRHNELSFNTILVVDVRSMFESDSDYQEAVRIEAEDATQLTKKIGRPLFRLLDRLRLQKTTFAAYGITCQVLLKLSPALFEKRACDALWLWHPDLPPQFVNQQLRGNQNTWIRSNPRLPVHLLFQSEAAQQKRLDMLRHVFPQGTHKIWGGGSSSASSLGTCLVACFSATKPDDDQEETPPFDPDYVSDQGKSLWFSQVTVEMSPYNKQYERHSADITADVQTPPEPTPQRGEEAATMSEGDLASIDWSTCEHQVGAVVLRGNRCVLVRSLQGEFNGMRVPSVTPLDNESPQETAIRSIVEQLGVDQDEVIHLPFIAPVSLYAPNGRRVYVTLYPFYASQPPPDGPLEDQDMEDEESPYDWYTYPNAMRALDEDPRSRASLSTLAMALMEAANVGVLPCKWGGVFGQEMVASNGSATALEAEVEEWNPSRQADVLQDVRKAKAALANNNNGTIAPDRIEKEEASLSYLVNIASAAKNKKLPVTILSGFLGSGKTTLMTHILTNYQGLRVAILVNDMSEVNIDAAVLRSNVSVHQREEHMVELSNGCICCTLREDLLTEIAKIAAASPSFDYLLIESSGISEPLPVAETFTFKDSTGLCLGDIACIDTLVTVVDASRFLAELHSLESLQERDWQADPEDSRTIAHLLCDQVEFANVVILNKCDLISNEGEKEKIKVKNLIAQMNPTAQIVESTYSAVSLNKVMGTGLFSMSNAEQHKGWLQEARVGEHKPESEEYGISSYTFRALRPFHPDRLHDALEAMAEHKIAPYQSILRAKGFVWLATRPEMQGDLSLAGHHYVLLPGNPWWATIDKADWPKGLAESIGPLWHEPHGDRQQEIVMIGQALDKQAVSDALTECLLTDDEMESGQDEWYKLCDPDPYQESWDAAIDAFMNQRHHSHDHEHRHSHEHSS